MKITRILCVVGCLALGVVAACHAYPPEPDSAPCSAPCCQPPSCCTSCSAAVKPVNDILTKLEALKAKKDAIELEERPLLVALKKEMKAQQTRMAKLGIAPEASCPTAPFSVFLTPPMMTEAPKPSTPMPAGAIKYAPAAGIYYEPVSTYRKVQRFDPETQTIKEITTPVTTYILRGPSAPDAAPCNPPAVPSFIRTPFLFDSPYSLTQPK
jgi:hypothetical protein